MSKQIEGNNQTTLAIDFSNQLQHIFKFFIASTCIFLSDKSIFSGSHFQNEQKTNLHMNQTETPGLCPCILGYLILFDALTLYT